MSKKQIFPINSKTACLLKWSWSTIFFQSGTTSSCHRTTKIKIPENDFASFHNLPQKLDDRSQMLKGLWPKNTCGYCKKAELAGTYSDRMIQLQQQTDASTTPPELLLDNSAVSVTPTYLEVYFRNTCNMSCVYCGPHLSSKWEEEIAKHGPMNVHKIKNNDQYSKGKIQKNELYEQQKIQLWKYLEENNRFKILRYFSLLGGEPLVIPELDECFNFWKNHPNENLTFQLLTNLKASDSRFDNFLFRVEELMRNKKILQFKIVASLDGIGPQQEYARYGLDLKQWMKNFEKLLTIKNLSVGINSAISSLTLHEFPALLEKIIEWNSNRRNVDRIIHSMNLDYNGITDPLQLGPEIFKKTLERCYELFQVKSSRELSIRNYWNGISAQIKSSSFNRKKIETLKKYLATLDARRNTDWQKTFPWLVNL